MKTKFFFAALVAMTLIGCGKAEPEIPIVPEVSDYKGTVTVQYQGEPFDNENIAVNFTPAEDGKTASITIYQIRFVPQMPVTIDVTIPNVTVQSTPEKILLSGDQIIPLAMGGDFPRYTVTGLEGEIVGQELVFSLNFGNSPTSFRGELQK